MVPSKVVSNIFIVTLIPKRYKLDGRGDAAKFPGTPTPGLGVTHSLGT